MNGVLIATLLALVAMKMPKLTPAWAVSRVR
jgi:hypothetical protein